MKSDKMKRPVNWKKMLSIILAFVMMVSMNTPMSVFAEEKSVDAAEVTEETEAVAEDAAAPEEPENILQEDGEKEPEIVLPEEREKEPEIVLLEETEEEAENAVSEESEKEPENDHPIPELNYQEIPGEGDYDSILEHLSDDTMMIAEMEALPEKYDPVKSASYLPAVRNQDPYGTCWAHSIIGAGEIGLTKNKGVDPSGIDLSELQIAYFMFNSPKTDPLGLVFGDTNILNKPNETFLSNGGNVNLAKKIMQGWIGAGQDAGELAYSEENAENALKNGLADDYAFEDVYHLENYYNVSIDNRDEAKKAILDYGALTASYHSDDNNYKSGVEGGTSYYYAAKTKTNHAVLIVGWDDNYAKENFISEPAGDGAWLIRNSWGFEGKADYSKYKYFWMSYYDASLIGGVALEFAPADKYDRNYHYDASAGELIYTVSNMRIANVFTAQGENSAHEMLEAVSFDVNSSNVVYDIDVYNKLTDPNDPESGTLAAEAEGKTSYEGYYTVSLDNYVPLSEGDIFSVVISFSHADGSTVSIPIESNYDYEWIKGTAASRAGESFYDYGAGWVDKGKDGEGNFRIKAFTKNSAEVAATGIAFDKSSFTMSYGEEKSAKARVLPIDATDKRIKWSSSKEDVATVSGGIIKAVGIGETTITATLEADDTVTASCSVRVIPSMKIKKPLDFRNADCEYGITHELSASFAPESAAGDYTLVWESSNTDVVTVSQDGILKTVGKGTAEVSLHVKENIELEDSLTVNVTRLADIYYPAFTTEDDYVSFTLSWDEVAGADRYVISFYEFDINGSGTLLKTAETKETSYRMVYPLEIGITYGYKVIAYNEDSSLRSVGYTYSYFRVSPKHKISYVLSGGTNHEDNPSEIREDELFSPRYPERTGYTFDGWYKDAAFTERFYYTFSVTEDLTLYAKWEPITYYIYYVDNGSTAGTMYSKRMTYDTEEPLDAVEFTKWGYTFKCWNTEIDGTGESYADQAKVLNLSSTSGYVVLYAIWTLAEYRIEYELNGGTNHEDNPASYCIDDDNILLKAPQRQGYEFQGWYEQEDFGGDSVAVIYTLGCCDKKLYAKWLKDDTSETPGESDDTPETPGDQDDETIETPGESDDTPETPGEGDDTPETPGDQGGDTPGTPGESGDTPETPGDKDDNKPGNKGEVTDSPQDIDDSNFEQDQRLDLAAAGGSIWTDFVGKTYDGLPYKPDVQVIAEVDGRMTFLTEGTDYRVLYENNIQVGTGRVIVKGNGIYKGELSKNFNIWPKSMEALKTVAGGMALNSTEQIPVYVYDGAKLLVEGRDYSLTVPSGMTATGGKKGVTVKAAAGSNYTGQKIVVVTVYNSDKVLNAADVTLAYDTASFTGKALKPAVTVKFGGSLLDKRYYTIKYTNNKDAGTAFVTVTGKKGYSGCVVKTFEITTVKEVFSLKKAISPVTYNGRPQKPKMTVKAGGRTLKAGRDYIVSYENNLHATKEGKLAHVTVRGIGNYANAPESTFDFVIKAQSVKKVKVTGTQDQLKLTYGTRILQKDKDYTAVYATGAKNGKISVTISGIAGSDFTGTVTRRVTAVN